MRLISIQTLKLVTFYGADEDIPPYAILSHTWGADELTIAQFTADDVQTHAHKTGYAKIQHCCRLAAAAGLDYVWVDTVCIDKSSSAELTEAINSMFRWYKNAVVCHAWLHDLAPGSDIAALGNCRWFSRGWTLQELLAPAKVEFYDRDWAFRGTKQDLRTELGTITKISEEVLEKPDRMFALPIAQRMSWAASRRTTRPEDLAYCLLGIFDVNMPLLYGEGDRAFFRLQEEISKETNDLSLFAWRVPEDDGQQQAAPKQPFHGIFATSPSLFRDCSYLMVRRDPALSAEYTITNKGVRLEADLTELDDGRVLLMLNVDSRPTGTAVCIWVRAHGGGLYSRSDLGWFDDRFKGALGDVTRKRRIYLLKRVSPDQAAKLAEGHRGAILLRDNFYRHGLPQQQQSIEQILMVEASPFEVIRMHPQEDWVSEKRMMYTHGAIEYFVFVWFQMRKTPIAQDSVFGEGVAVLAVGMLAYETRPFALLMGTDLASRVMPPGGKLNRWLLMSSRGNAGSVTLPLYKGGGGVRLSVSLESAVVDNELVHCVDLSYFEVPRNSGKTYPRKF